MAQVYLLLGSNTGNTNQNLKTARAAIETKVGKIISSSSVYRTEPWGLQDQPWFLNQLVVADTARSPHETLAILMGIEEQMGRERTDKWGPRTLDIDILYFDSEIVVSRDLKIPHPEIQFRNFVLIPLAEVSPGFKHPVLNLTNRELLERCEDTLRVEKTTGE